MLCFAYEQSIPVAFTTSLGGKKLDKALFKSCQGSWDVKVGRTGHGVFYFEEGWKEFVKNHSLEVGEFLVSEHKGNMDFNVKVYELRGCEKEFPPPSSRIIVGKTHRNQCAVAERKGGLSIANEKDGDLCLFEFIEKPKSRSKPAIMDVKIFRFGS
ncbi:hypothetical protein ACFX11_019566 [Malus domestica]|uniref:TF-B3 domain-containing protein n=1 Tax=Malus domestica TaxID=3750 RepID=A0A498HWI1_MALDO|nr:hypothetical protein DVH24_039515 [Malus domestica]